MVEQAIVAAVILGAIYLLFALGLTLIFGIMHIIQFAHGEIYMLGAFAGYYLINVFGTNYAASVVITIGLIILLGMGLQKAVFAPLTGKVIPTLAMSFGLLLALQGGAFAAFGGKEKMIHTPLTVIIKLPGGVVSSTHNLLILGVTAALVVGLYYFIQNTKQGRAMRAIEQDMDTAALQGINISRINLLAFAIGCGLAGAAGVMVGSIYPVEPIMGGGLLLKAFGIIIVGGIGSFIGAIIAAFIWTFLEVFSGLFLGGQFAFIVCFTMIILVLIFRPTGLFGHVPR